MEYLPINDLPNELLELIFDHLDVDDLKHASLVCKRWSDLAFSGQRMDRVVLMPKFPRYKYMLQSSRKYRHLELGRTEKCSAHVKELFQAFDVSSLRIEDINLSHSSLRLILLEAPNLQHLSIWNELRQMNETIEPFPVMRKLERLEIENQSSALLWHTVAPSLQGLKMDCESEDQLEQWRLFSGQLKQVYATCSDENSLNRFCEMTFPLLEELSIMFFGSDRLEARNSFFTRHEFFRRNGSLRRLCLGGIHLSKTLVKDITNHSKKLTSLEIIGAFYEDEPGSLESLEQLTELKHLRLDGLNTNIFRGCEELTSLQSLSISDTMFSFSVSSKLGFLEDLFKIAPQLGCLELGSVVMPARAVHFICHHFTKLTRLQLKYSEKITRDGLSGINRLQHLSYLELHFSKTSRLFIGIIPKNTARYITLHIPNKYDEDDLLRLPESFLQLERLNLVNRWCHKNLRESTVDRLRQLFPTCAIKTYGRIVNNKGKRRFGRTWTRREIMPVWEKEWAWRNLYS